MANISTYPTPKDNKEDRSITLLKAVVQLLEKQAESCDVLDLLEESVDYDNEECDGYCLLDDIRAHLEIE